MSDIDRLKGTQPPEVLTSIQPGTVAPPIQVPDDSLGLEVISAVSKKTAATSNPYAASAPKLEAPTVQVSATTDPDLFADGNFATLLPADFTSLLGSALVKTQDPTSPNGTDIVLNGQSVFAPLVQNIGTLVTTDESTATKNILQQMASDPSNPLYGTDIPDDDVNGNPIDYSGLKDIVYLLALLLGQMPTMQAKCTDDVLQSLQNMTSAISNSIKEQIAQQQQAQAAEAAAEESAQKTSKWSDIFGWIASGLAIIAGVALIATGVGTAAGIGLVLGGALMLGNQIFQDTGLYQKSPKFAEVMSYFMPIAQAVIAIATGGASEGILAATSVALTCLASAATVTDNALTETNVITEGDDTDQALQYTAMGLGILGTLVGMGSSLKGEGAEVPEAEKSATQKGLNVVSKTAQGLEAASSGVESGLTIATGVTELKVADYEYQINLIKADVTKLNTMSDVDQQYIQMLVTALQQYLSMIPNISKALNNLISAQGEAATATLR